MSQEIKEQRTTNERKSPFRCTLCKALIGYVRNNTLEIGDVVIHLPVTVECS